LRFAESNGLAFLEDGGAEVRSHLRRFVLFQALSESIEHVFADDIRQYVEESREPSGVPA
jgi:hypothetical protein